MRGSMVEQRNTGDRSSPRKQKTLTKMAMKANLLGVALAASAVASFALADENQSQRPGDGNRGGLPRDPAAFFRSLDTNGDGVISREEAGERWERLSALDRDGDGKISLEEFRAAREGMRRPDGAGRPEGAGRPDGASRPEGARRPDGAGRAFGGGEELFKRLDRNEDGKISKDEVPEEMWARLSRLDTDEDGHISREEFLAGADAMRGATGEGRRPGSAGEGGPRSEELFKRLDRNEDGKISKDEVPEEMWTRLSRLDTDEDGHISREEFLAGAAALRGAMDGARRPGAPGAEGPRRPGSPGRSGAGGAGGGADAVFSRYDANKDGKLSEDEVPAELWARIRRADEDGDGMVSLEELRRSYQARPEPERPAPEAERTAEGTDDAGKKEGADPASAESEGDEGT